MLSAECGVLLLHPALLKSHLQNLHVSQEAASAPTLCQALSLGLLSGDHLRLPEQRRLDSVTSSHSTGHQRSGARRHQAEVADSRLARAGGGRNPWDISVSDAVGGDWDFARY